MPFVCICSQLAFFRKNHLNYYFNHAFLVPQQQILACLILGIFIAWIAKILDLMI
jgi:hypothetical protein